MNVVIFAWDEWNIDHVAGHGVSPYEAEFVIRESEAPWPQQKGDGKLVAWGPTETGRLLQVIFVLKAPDEIEFESLTADEWAGLDEDDRAVYVIHAMELTAAMKRLYRRRRR